MSVSGSAPTTRARRMRPSDSLTSDPLGPVDDVVVREDAAVRVDDEPAAGAAPRRVAVAAPRTGRASPDSSGWRRRRAVGARGRCVVASMFTTAGLMRSTTSAKLTSGGSGRARRRDAAACRRGTSRARRPARHTVGRAKPPATIAPTRNATTAVSASVTNVKRRDIRAPVFHYKSQKSPAHPAFRRRAAAPSRACSRRRPRPRRTTSSC